ncbi:hypothetical protein ACFL23_01430 [Patescibacteria group bacterium]
MFRQTTRKQNSVWPDGSIYFLTDSTFIHFPYFRTAEQKQIVLNQIKKLENKVDIKVEDYSIAMNHYHLKFYLERGADFAKVKQLLRGGISYEYRKRYKVPYREMWQSGKVLILKSEKISWRVSGYIIGNLLKHKEISTFSELRESEFSTYRYKVEIHGDSEMRGLVCSIINVNEDAWGVVDIQTLYGAKAPETRTKVR